MVISDDIRRMGLAGLAGLFALLAFGVFIREYNSFYAGAGVSPQAYIVSEGAFAATPMGLQSVTRELGRCLSARAQLGSAVLKPEARMRGYQTCLDLADGILRSTPAHGGALQLRAEMLADLGDSRAGGNADVIEAQLLAAQAAPQTMWLMQRRVALALSQAEKTSGDAAEFGDARIAQMVARDVTGLLGVYSMHEWLAQYYVRHPALRRVIEGVEGQILAKDGAAFVRRLRAQLRKSGGATP